MTAAAQLKSTVDRRFGERVRHLPQADGTADAARAVAEIIAVIRTDERARERAGAAMGHPGLAANGGELRIDRQTYPALAPRQGDLVVAVDRPGAPVFELLHVDDRNHLRLVCALGDA